MQIIPSIDILNGRCVQLINGKIETVEIFGKPEDYLDKWKKSGAKIVHVIDLDAALNIGSNKEKIITLLSSKNVEFQVGGGIRSVKYATELIKKGASRIIVGSKAFDEDFLKKLNQKIPLNKIMIAIDVKSEKILINGWQTNTNIDFEKGFKKLKKYAGSFLITDVSFEGMLNGPNYKLLEKLKQNSIPIFLSGGFSSIKDIKLAEKNGFSGVIVGRALYKNRIKLKELK